MLNFIDQFQKIEFPNLGFIKMPSLFISTEQLKNVNLDEGATSENVLRALAARNFNLKLHSYIIPPDKLKEYQERLEFELNEIIRLQFTDYILLIYQIIDFCKQNDILNSPGRGSCVGSLLLYVLGVTKVDPMKHDLLFERFISSARTEVKQINGETYIASSSLPDVDIDSDRALKYKINEYISEKFPNKSAPISTYGTFQSKILIKECLKVVENYKDSETKPVADLIEAHFGKVETIDDAIEANEEFKSWAENHIETIRIAKKLHGLIRNKSTHASGIIISNDELLENMPLELNADKQIVVGYDMEFAQMHGVKVDNLGLKNLGIVNTCLNLVGKKMDDIDVNDLSIYQFLALHKEYYHGIFQVEEGLGKRVLQKIEPTKIDDIAASVSIARPGSYRFIDEYINHKKGIEIKKVDNRISDILAQSNFVIIWQEQIMQLSRKMARFTPQEADGLRRGIGKKIVAKVKEYKEKFIEGSIKNGFERGMVEDIWQTFEDSGNYLFNKSHGFSYSYLTAITCWLKALYTKEFFLSLLKMSKFESEPIQEIAAIQQEMNHFGIKLLPPHIIKSDLDFSIEGADIRFGLGSIKGIAEKTIERLSNFRDQYSNKFEIFAGAEDAQIPLSVITPMIQAGSLEGFTQSRSKVTLESCVYKLLTQKEKKYALQLGADYNFDLLKIILDLKEKIKDEKGKPIISEKRFETIRKKYEPYKQIYLQNSKSEKLANYFYEKKLLGYSYS
ncbi:MAG: hypothetical protein AABY22_02305, partial [Nanoarchaeota archaeon]